MRFASTLAALLLSSPVWAQPPLPPGIRAGFEAYQEAEWQRRIAVAQQVRLNRGLRYPVLSPSIYDQTIYYDAAYGGPPLWSTFGYGYVPMIRQPIGQRQVQSGPRTWESFPVYAEDLAPGPVVAAPVAPVEIFVPETPPPPREARRQEF